MDVSTWKIGERKKWELTMNVEVMGFSDGSKLQFPPSFQLPTSPNAQDQTRALERFCIEKTEMGTWNSWTTKSGK
ncbi:unnamed protein product [Sphenostylis stenocarpa]|uniref:Uncharacterized protein n=1 Tax=Sphenostylis stenocarpa TaxID=92480 RepID=A0AA86VTK6_9FABA|nr:unnamed protein product [Sphenostylis stenocarpa]